MAMNRRGPIAALSLSAAALVAWVSSEGWSDVATPPVPGDVPTYGFGTTTHEDGTPLQSGERITPPRAIKRVAQDARRFERELQRCMADVELAQFEYDAYVLLGENVGAGAVCRSSIPAKLRAKQYEAACKTILDFRRVQGRDCSLAENRRFCGGVWTARQQNARLCLTGEYPS